MKHFLSFVLCYLVVSAVSVSGYGGDARDGWVIEAQIDTDGPYFGITSANGTLGLVSSREPFKCGNVVLADTYDIFGRGGVANFLPQVNPLELEITVDGNKIEAAACKDYVQRMDLADGTFSGSFVYDGHRVRYAYRALRQLPHAALMDVEITAVTPCDVCADNIHTLPSSQHGGETTSRTLTFHHKEGTRIDLMTTWSLSPTDKIRSVASSAFVADGDPAVYPGGEKRVARLVRRLDAGETLSFQIVGVLISSAQVADPLNQAERIVTSACVQGRDELLRRHRESWDRIWEGDIRIEGDPEIQLEVRSMLYHLYAFTRAGGAFSPSPMGLSGLGYNGHVFWDTEIFMFPPLLVLNPDLARSMVQYRFERLPQAMRNASSWGYEGAMFPWESADSGTEECPVTALAGTLQHHVTADVAIAAWHYYLATHDKAWLRETGWPILEATARFWTSRVVPDDEGKYHIRGVMGADEWAVYVDDDAYTNGAARRNLECALAAAKVLKVRPPKLWKKIAGSLVFETFENGVTREHASYDGAKIKQADAVLLYWPLGLTDGTQALRDLAYYQEKVPAKGTPAMTKCINCIICAREGKTEEALRWFTESYRPNARPPFGVIAEFEGGKNPYFLTGAGGAIQSLIFGFGGYDFTSKGLVRGRQHLPGGWVSLSIGKN